jgi:hypothetical protein
MSTTKTPTKINRSKSASEGAQALLTLHATLDPTFDPCVLRVLEAEAFQNLTSDQQLSFLRQAQAVLRKKEHLLAGGPKQARVFLENLIEAREDEALLETDTLEADLNALAAVPSFELYSLAEMAAVLVPQQDVPEEVRIVAEGVLARLIQEIREYFYGQCRAETEAMGLDFDDIFARLGYLQLNADELRVH